MDEMNNSEWLSEAEVAELTGVSQGAAQLRRLEAYGLHVFRRPDGRPMVSRWAVRMKAAGAIEAQGVDAGITWKRAGPNWGAMRNGRQKT